MDFVRIPLEGEAESPGMWYVLRKFNALIDAEDAELVHSLGLWHVAEGRHGRLFAYNCGDVDTKLHNLVMGAGAGEKVWALNDDLLDCRKQNLRNVPRKVIEERKRAWEAREPQRRKLEKQKREREAQEKWKQAREDRKQATLYGFRYVKDYRAWRAACSPPIPRS